MINIINNHNCCGCAACVQICPKQCISFDENDQGFRYPLVNKELCVDCALCEKVCPFLNQVDIKIPLKVYAAINPNETIRMKSSSGGIFTMLAEKIIEEGGFVFGARFNEKWEVVHSYADSKKELDAFRGSKYVQSTIGDTYNQTLIFLKTNRKVLFSGTPCQIAGLKNFLRKDFDNLITIDVVCHGVPSPKIWREYISSLTNISDIQFITHKDKRTGWRTSSFTIKKNQGEFSEKSNNNKYLLSFSKNLNLRLSCFNCPVKGGKSNSDITLADYWGVEHLMPEMYDNKGTSFVACNTQKGLDLFNLISAKSKEGDFFRSITYNSCYSKSTLEPTNAITFWEKYQIDGINVLQALQSQHPNFIKHIIKKILDL